MLGSYRFAIIETYLARGEPSRHAVRARVLSGQGFPRTMRVECSASMRESHPVPTKFKVWAKIKGTVLDSHLYTSWQWEYWVVSDAEAKQFIRAGKWSAET